MARIQVTYPDRLEPLLDARVAQLRRFSRSNHVAALLEEDLRAAGLLSAEQTQGPLAELIAKLRAAAAVSPRIVNKVEATLRREMRTERASTPAA